MSNIPREVVTADMNSVESVDSNAPASKGKAGKEKKSRWRDIERITRKLKLLRDLREINPEFDPYSSDEFMQF